MNKKKIEKLDLDLYSCTLENGLDIYIIPKKSVNNIYATFSTKFGGLNTEFVPNGEEKMITVPDGVAHFLEHQLFNQEDGIDPLNFFTSNGASGNANTSNYKTTYLFSGPDNFEANLTYLLDFVQTPYFTDESVNKEKGIIEQEINMYLDDPYSESYERLKANTFIKHPMKKNVIGSVKSINSITKEDLYTCYNTFYHPSNMFIVITGNVDPIHTISLIEENQKQKSFSKKVEIKQKKYDEPDNVLKEHEILKLNITIPKVLIGYKINMNNFDIEQRDLRRYISIMSNIKFGSTSLFWDELKESNLTSEYIGYSLICTDSHALLIIDGETHDPNEFIKRIKEEIVKFNIDSEEFERKKKGFLSSTIYASDNIYSINNSVMSDIIDCGTARTDIYESIKKLDFETFKKVFEKIDFSNVSDIIVEPK